MERILLFTQIDSDALYKGNSNPQSVLKLIATIAFLAAAIVCAAQPADSIKKKKNYWPTGIRLGTDLIALGKIPWSSEFDGWEASADVDLDRYYFTVEMGSWEKSKLSPDQSYTNSGNYFRIGADVNFLLKDPDKNMFFVGLRYGRSSFSEQLTYTISDKAFGDSQANLSNESMTAGWGEVTVGLRVKIWKALWMGYTARLKVGATVEGAGEFIPYDIPGYGLASKSPYWGFNYQLYWRIPVRN